MIKYVQLPKVFGQTYFEQKENVLILYCISCIQNMFAQRPLVSIVLRTSTHYHLS